MSTDASRAAEDSEHTEPDRPGESEAQRDDRNFIELLNELRVAGIGVQVLFGFLLACPSRIGSPGSTPRSAACT